MIYPAIKIIRRWKIFSELDLKYLEQTNPGGIAEAFVIAEKFIDLEDVMLVLGDNIFYGNGFISLLKNSISKGKKQKLLSYFLAVMLTTHLDMESFPLI